MASQETKKFNRVVINPTNLKCSSLPLFSLRNQYAINFHLTWAGFCVAFLSWFAFAPLIPDAIKQDLKLTPEQIGYSNVISLCATLCIDGIVGPLVDRYGPRKVMAGLLVVGAIPSGLAGTAHTATGLYLIRFFIGILGATFVTCQAWTTAFFDKNVVGTANALAGGWGNAGGGVAFVVMIALYNGLLSSGLTPHVAWRAAFVIVPVPCMLLAATAMLLFGTDHPAGKWSDRHRAIAHPLEYPQSDNVPENEKADTSGMDKDDLEKKGGLVGIQINVEPVENINVVSELDYAVNEVLTPKIAWKVITTPLTWLPALAYGTTFGFEIAMNSNFAGVLLSLYQSENFGQTKAGYITAIFGFLNVFTRVAGGYLGDSVYKKWGVPGKKYLTILLGISQGLLSFGLGMYIDRQPHPSLSVLIVFIILLALACEAANGVIFSLVPHCNPRSNGFTSGIVGGTGVFGGVAFGFVFRFQPFPLGKAFWIVGIVTLAIHVMISIIRVPRV